MMQRGLPDAVREKLKELTRQFILGLPNRMQVLNLALTEAEGQPEFDTSVFFDAKNAAHKLAGSGETFGFASISNLAREIELLLDNAMKKNRILSSEETENIRGLYHTLAGECEQAQMSTIQPLEPSALSAIMANSTSMPNGKRHLCIWEDSALYFDDLEEQFGFFGFHVVKMKDLSPARRLLAANSPIILLLDVGHVERNEDIAQEIKLLRQDEISENLKILFLSEKDDFQTRLSAVRHGSDAFFAAPFDIPRLIDKVDSLSAGAAREPYHILIVDDDPEQISYYAMILQQAGMITSVVTEPANVMRILVESKPELILLDMYMPDCSGIELASLIRQQEAFVGIPIVYFSVEKDVEKQISAIKRGGDDFLTKPIKPEHLITAVTIRAERTRQLRFFMERDSMTGLLNHNQLKARLVDEVDRVRRIGSNLCYAMIDIDHFKKVNDDYGHLNGDRVIKALSRLLLERLRKTDTVGRYGGEEFGIILFNTDIKNGERIMNEIRQSFSRIRQRGGDKDFFVTFSCGLVDFPRYPDAEVLGTEADSLLYEAKKNGRNLVVIPSA